MILRYTTVALMLLFSLPLFASPAQEAQETAAEKAFHLGDFNLARTLGRKGGSADALAQACRAGLVIGGFLEKGPTAIRSLHGAITDCDKALRLKPHHFTAQISLAIALSFEGKRLNRPKYPLRAQAYILDLIKQDPTNPVGYGALAAWHSEVSARGFWARLLLGARRKKAAENFARALELGMQGFGVIDYALRLEYVKYLARGNKKSRRKARTEAEKLLLLKGRDAFDEILRERCKHILTALKGGKKSSIKAAVEAATAFQNASPEHSVERFPLEKLGQASKDQNP